MIYILTNTKSIFLDLSNEVEIVESISLINGEGNIVITANYTNIIPNEYLKKNTYLNIHNSLLPKYRGLHAFAWAIINNEKQVGYTLHVINKDIDAGPILSQITIDVNFQEDINQLLDKSTFIMIEWLKRLIPKINIDFISKAEEQDESKATYVCRRGYKDGLIDWNQSSLRIYNLIRAISPPYTKGAYTFWCGSELTIISAELFNLPDYIGINGQIVARLKGRGVLVKCEIGILLVKEIEHNNCISNGYDFFKTVGARLG